MHRRRTISRIGLVAFIVGLACLGCSKDHPAQVAEPRISDLGELVEVHEFADGSIEEYTYEGVTFVGDILVSEYEYALTIVEPRYSGSEVLLSVINGRVLPPSRLFYYFAHADGYVFKTCTADSVENCDRGMLYSFRETLDGYGLEPVLFWRSMH